jgi:hypothetical protein
MSASWSISQPVMEVRGFATESATRPSLQD